MMRMHHRAVLGGLAVAGLLLLLASVAARADGPVKSSFSYDYTGSGLWGPAGEPVTCGGEPVLIDGVAFGTTTVWRDADGNVTHVKAWGRNEESWYLASNPNRRLRAKANYNTFTLTPGADLYAGTERWTGLFWHVVAPGVGTVLLDAGLEIIDWTAAGPVVRVAGKHQWLDGDFDTLCTALLE